MNHSKVTIGVLLLFGTVAARGQISYQVNNHPDGSETTSATVDSTGYVLRLDLGGSYSASGVNTFNANHTDLSFNYTPGSTTATMTGMVTHNQSGSSSGYDATDDVYQLSATFGAVLFTDSTAAPGGWYGANDDETTYDDMVSDLRDNMDASGSSNMFSDDVARIYFRSIDLQLTYLGAGTPDFDGPLHWDEYPNITPPLSSDDMPMYLQYRWRLNEGGAEFSSDDFDIVAGAGWLQPHPNGTRPVSSCCNDLLFTLSPEPVPAPGAALLCMMGLGCLGQIKRHFC